MRIVLIGAVESTRLALEVMVASGHAPCAVVTLLPEAAARHSDYVDLAPLARRSGIPLHYVVRMAGSEALDTMAIYRPDYLFVIGWSQILPPEVLGIAGHGAIGYHPSLLPANRGRGVIPWTILQGASRTGSTLFWIDDGVDSGDVITQERFAVAPDETASTLYTKHLRALERILRNTLANLASGNPPRIRQDHTQATFCARRIREDGRIDWHDDARRIWTLIRATTRPYPGAFTVFGDREVILWQAKYIGHGPYWGRPGQVQSITSEGLLVQCGDTEHVLITEFSFCGDEPSPVVRAHDRFGSTH